MLVGARRAAVPGVVRDVDEKVGAPPPVAPREVLEDRLVADEHPKFPDRGRVQRQPASLPEPAEPPQMKPMRRDERHPLDDGHQVTLVIDRVKAAASRGIVEKRRIVVVVAFPGTELDVEAAGQQGGARFPHALRDRGVPVGPIDEVIGYRRLGPEQQVEVGAVLESPREREQLSHHAVLTRPVPFLAEALVRLDQPDRPRFADRQRSHAPRPVPPREEHRPDHRGQRAPPHRPAPCSQLPAPNHRLHQHHVAPREPQRHAAGPGEVGPLHQHGCIRERRAQPEPGKADVSLMGDDPFDRGPGDGEHDPQWNQRQAPPHADDEPEHQGVPQAVDRDGGEVAEPRERGEVPQRHHEPVEHRPLRDEPVPEAPGQRGPRVRLALELPQQHDRGGERDEADDGEVKRRIAGDEQDGARRDEDGGPGHHSSTSRPSSAERYTASSARCSASWSRGGGAFTSPRITARK